MVLKNLILESLVYCLITVNPLEGMGGKLRFFGIIWGILMTSQDLNIYLTYLLPMIISPNIITCHNFLHYYALFAFINTIISGIYYPISGWLTDYTSTRTPTVFICTNILQLIFVLLQLLPLLLVKIFEIKWIEFYGWIIFCVFWQITQIVSIQNNNSLWKLIKQYIECSIMIIDPELLYERPFNDENKKFELINYIGNTGDLTSDICETLLLTLLAILLLFFKLPYDFIVWYIVGLVITFNLILCIVSIKSFHFDTNYHTNYILNDTHKTPDFNPYSWCKNSVIEFYNNKIVFHIYWHCILLVIFSALVQYPLSLREISVIDISSNKTIDNYCGGTFINIILLAALTNSTYLFGSVLYRLFIIRISPITFYKYYYPFAIIILMGMALALWFKINYIMILILVSFSTIIPYYLTYYDYYLFTKQSKGEYYGFVLGLYGTSTTLIAAMAQLLYFTNVPFIVILSLSIILLLCVIIYSYYIAYLLSNNIKEYDSLE